MGFLDLFRNARQPDGATERARTPASKPQGDGVQRPSKRRTTLYHSDYISRDDEADALIGGQDGLPDACLETRLDRLVIVTRVGIVNPKSTYTYRVGIFSFTIRGTGYHIEEATAGEFRPGSRVKLVREPDNPHDANAIAIYAQGARKLTGYVNKRNAARLATLMDAGLPLAAISTRGNASGFFEFVPQILVCSPRLMEHLLRVTKFAS